MSITKQLLMQVAAILIEDRDVQDCRMQVLTEDRMDLLAALQTATAKLGLVAILTVKSREPGTGNQEVWVLDVLISENVLLNRGASGSRVSSVEACDLVVATLSGSAPAEEWSPLRFTGQGEASEESGLLTRTVTFRTETYPQPTDLSDL